ncbi:MAG: restriction endonuclease subunit S [Thermoplasmataceae archaeon]
MNEEGPEKAGTGKMTGGWEIVTIGDPRVVIRAQAGGTPLRSNGAYYEGGDIPFVKIEDMVNAFKFLDRTFEQINELGLKESSSWIVPPNSVLFSMYASYGEVSINKLPVATNQAIIALVPNIENVNVDYLYYQLKKKKQSLSQYLRSTTQNNLNAEIVKNLKIPLPSLPEQQKIAEILSTADEVIQKVNEQITLTERLKKGLMHKLLTNGIGHTRFRETDIGEIPERWSIKTIQDCSLPTSSINPGTVFGKEVFQYIDVSGVSSEKLTITETKRIQGINAPSRARKHVKERDVIFATIRPYLKRVAIVPKNLDNNVCSTAFCVMRANRDLILPDFLYYYTTFDSFVNRISEFQTGSAYPAVSDNQILSAEIPLPPLQEQEQISKILNVTDNKLSLLRYKKEKYEELRNCLMGDLLTGNIRVKV